MLVISHTMDQLGSAAILYADIRKMVAQKLGGQFWAIPSSIHEWVAVRANGPTYGDIAEMIRDVNSSIVKVEERLGDHPYLFDEEGNLVEE